MKREHYREKLRENVKHLEKMKQYVCEVERAQNVEELERAETVAITKITKQVSMEDITLLCWATGDPLLNFLGYLPWVSKAWWIPCMLYHLAILRFTSGATPTGLLMASIEANPFDPFTFSRIDTA